MPRTDEKLTHCKRCNGPLRVFEADEYLCLACEANVQTIEFLNEASDTYDAVSRLEIMEYHATRGVI